MRLSDIWKTLPPAVEDRDRPVRFEGDGTIVYERREGDWEPPREINGYVRDPLDTFVLIPLWPECDTRHQMGVRLESCGCIDIAMRCNHPEHPMFGELLTTRHCQNCHLRRTE